MTLAVAEALNPNKPNYRKAKRVQIGVRVRIVLSVIAAHIR